MKRAAAATRRKKQQWRPRDLDEINAAILVLFGDEDGLPDPFTLRVSRRLFSNMFKKCTPDIRAAVEKGSGSSWALEDGEVSGWSVDADSVTMYRYSLEKSGELARIAADNLVTQAAKIRAGGSRKYSEPLQALVNELVHEDPSATTAGLWEGIADAEKQQEAIVEDLDDPRLVYKIYRDGSAVVVVCDHDTSERTVARRSFERYVQRARRK